MPPKRSKAAQAAASRKKGTSTNSPSLSNVKLVTELGPNDVLMGRGALATDYEGNLRLRELVHARINDYTLAQKRNRKHQIAEEIVAAVQARDGRFLQSAETLKNLDPGALPRHVAAWFIVEDHPVLVAKVKQLLRDIKPRKKSIPPRAEQEASEPSKVLLASATSTSRSSSTTTTTTTTTSSAATSSGVTAPHPQHHQFGLNFLWRQQQQQQQQQHHQEPNTEKAPAVAHPVKHHPPTVAPACANVTTNATACSTSPPPPWMAALGSLAGVAAKSSPPLASQPATIQQHQAGISKHTSLLGQENAMSILQSLISGGSSRDQQFDAILALSLASRLAPKHTSAPVAGHRDTGPTPEQQYDRDRNRDLTALAQAILEQNQRREREHALANTLLAELLPRIIEGRQQQQQQRQQSNPPLSSSSSSPRVPSPVIDPSMSWLFNQLQKCNDHSQATAAEVARAPPTAATTTPATTPASPSFADLTAFLRGEQAAPRSTGLLEQPARLAELERLLLSRDRWSQQQQQQAPSCSVPAVSGGNNSSNKAAAPPPPPAPESSFGNPEDGLARLLHSLQRQYFPRPPTP